MPSRPGQDRLPFSADMAELLATFKPPVVSFHFGLPSADLMARVKSWGAKVLSSATTVDEARWLEAHGADAVIAQGLEAGGHRGMFLTDDVHTQVGTFALLPQIVQAVKVPVIAAGGIADATGVAAAMALGAAGVQVGTAYLTLPRGHHQRHAPRRPSKASRPASQPSPTVFTGAASTRHRQPHHEEAGPHLPGRARLPAGHGRHHGLARQSRKPRVTDFTPLWAGQNTSGCQNLPAAESPDRHSKLGRKPGRQCATQGARPMPTSAKLPR